MPKRQRWDSKALERVAVTHFTNNKFIKGVYVPKFIKKPVEIEARMFNPGNDHDEALEVVAWCGGEAVADGCAIHTLEGVMVARPGDWIIRGMKGEFYPCKPDIFADTYDPA